MLAEYQEVWQF